MRLPSSQQLINQKFTRLLVIGVDTCDPLKVICVCDCGVKKSVSKYKLLSSHTKSCGCLQREITSKRSKTHGQRHTPEYQIWLRIKSSCYNKNHPAYKDYGQRGIKVCKRWFNSPEKFLKDIGKRPLGHSLDRINNSKGYDPHNVRWADRVTQMNNTRFNHRIEYKNKTYTLAQASRKFSINYNVLKRRIHRNWNIERAIETPVKRINHHEATEK